MIARRHEIAFALGLLLVGLIGFAAVEGALRLRDANMARRGVDWTALADAAAKDRKALMLEFRPGARFGEIRFNSHGFRGPELAVPAPPGTVRIAFLGDSKMFSGELPEDATIPAQTVAQLQARFPACRFDYVMMAGPGYTLPFLTSLFAARAPDVQPHMAVLMAGSATDLVAPSSARANASADRVVGWLRGPGSFGPLLDKSMAVRLVARELRTLSPATPPSEAATQPISVLRVRYRTMIDALGKALAGRPVVAISYRSRGETGGTGLMEARRLRQTVPGLGVEKARQISELIVEEKRRQAKDAGWRYIDPVAAIAKDRRMFADRSHFSALGTGVIAQAVAAEVGVLLGPDCRLKTKATEVRG